MVPAVKPYQVVALLSAVALPTFVAAAPVPQATLAFVFVQDQSSPKATVKSLYDAMFAGDAAAMRSLMLLTTEDDRKFFDLMAPTMAASGKLMATSQERFGRAPMGGAGSVDLNAFRAMVDRAEVSVDGDSAVVKVPPTPEEAELLAGSEQPPFELKQVDGKWVVGSAASLGMDPAMFEDPEAVRVLERTMGAMAKIAEDLEREVRDGKFNSADAVGEALMSRSMQVMVEAEQALSGDDQPPTTGPGAE